MGGVLPPGEDAAVGIADVIERLRTIEASAPPSDGVACFARLYLAVTEGVGADLTGRGFADARFLETLDVHFAGLFFAALESYRHDPASAPSAWVPLFAPALPAWHRSAAVRACGDERAHQSRPAGGARHDVSGARSRSPRGVSAARRLRAGGRPARPGREAGEERISDRLAGLDRPDRPPPAAHR